METYLGYDRAMEVAQGFLGDLGVVDTTDPDHVRATDDVFIIRFRTAAQALDANTVVLVQRAGGAARYATVDPEEPDPWPDARPVLND